MQLLLLGGVFSAREAFKNPELVLNHMTEEGATFSVSLQDIKIPGKPNYYWYDVIIETATNKKNRSKYCGTFSGRI